MRTKHQILAKSLAGVEYDVYIENYCLQELDKALQSFMLRLVDEFCHANNKTSNHVMLLVQLGINSTCDVRKFCQIGLAAAAHPILAKFANITRTINP